LTLPGFYAVLDVELATRHGWKTADLARAVLDGGCRLVQLRAKTLGSADLLRLADALVAVTAARGAQLIVNDRADVALLSSAAGVHVGQDDLDIAHVRRIVGGGAIVGWSSHSPQQVQDSLTRAITYLAVGPVFGTSTKQTGYAPFGYDLVRRAAAATPPGERPRPVVAIGGITLDRVADTIAAGAASVAVLSDLFTTGNPTARAREFVRAVGAAGAAL
jgi:thiamine-phosphate pyrophosphorylase